MTCSNFRSTIRRMLAVFVPQTLATIFRQALAAFVSVVLASGLAFAGEPLAVTGSAATQPGQAFVWPSGSTVRYTVDSGPLSATPSGQVVINNAQGLTRVKNLFQNWQSVPTTSITYTYAGPITGIAGGDVKTVQDFNTVKGTCTAGTQNPVIFDANGSLFSGLGLDPLVIGFASTCKMNAQTGQIMSAMAVLNGIFQDGISTPSDYELSADQFDEAMTHELGHFSGLGHSQINLALFQSGVVDACNTDDLAGLPLMFPVEFCQSRKSVGLPILSPDDVAWISKLYPAANYASSYGTISGFIFFSDGITAAQGANVIARRVDDPSTPEDESKRIAVSCVSGFLFTGNPGQNLTGDNTGGSQLGSRNPALIGYYEIPVPPGSYTVEVEAIDSEFSGGSSVGPLDPPAPVPPEFWHNYESGYDDPSLADSVTVAAGQKISNLNIILNGTPSRFDANEDGDIVRLEPAGIPFLLRVPKRLSVQGEAA
jgi:hypothetical protein